MSSPIKSTHPTAEGTENVLVLCGTKGGHGYVVSDIVSTVAEAVESARDYGGTALTKGYTAYEFGKGITGIGHSPVIGVFWEWGYEKGSVTITERTSRGRIKSTTYMFPPQRERCTAQTERGMCDRPLDGEHCDRPSDHI